MLWLRAAPACYIYAPSPIDTWTFEGTDERMRSMRRGRSCEGALKPRYLPGVRHVHVHDHGLFHALHDHQGFHHDHGCFSRVPEPRR